MPADTVTALSEPALDTEIVELADVDEIKLTAAAERQAIADSELKAKYDNYLTLHCALLQPQRGGD